MQTTNITGYLAPETYESDLQAEIDLLADLKIVKKLDRLFLVEGPVRELAFSQNRWSQMSAHSFDSISQASQILKQNGKLWASYSRNSHRRAALIQEQLPRLKLQPQIFPAAAPARPLGAWTLEDEKTLWLSPQTDSPFALGEVLFQEDKSAPSRAYLKLWEYFTVSGHWPKPGEKCLDLGSSPGGWTWVLDELGCEVISVDKAPLADALKNRPRIHKLKQDAFTLRPEDVGAIDWLFSDIICYPEKLDELVQLWLQSGLVRNFVCTIKFQKETDFQTLHAFREIPGSQVRHLFCNKHEVTWSLIRP